MEASWERKKKQFDKLKEDIEARRNAELTFQPNSHRKLEKSHTEVSERLWEVHNDKMEKRKLMEKDK